MTNADDTIGQFHPGVLAGAENVAILGTEKNAHTHIRIAVKRQILSLYLNTTAPSSK